MKYVFVAMAMLWAGAAWAQGTRHDQGATLGGMSFELILPTSLGLEHGQGYIKLRNHSRNQPSAREVETYVGITLERANPLEGQKTSYRFGIVEKDQAAVTAFWDAHGRIPSFIPAINPCLNGPIQNNDRISYRLYRPGFGSTPMQHMDASKLRAITPPLAPCPTPR